MNNADVPRKNQNEVIDRRKTYEEITVENTNLKEEVEKFKCTLEQTELAKCENKENNDRDDSAENTDENHLSEVNTLTATVKDLEDKLARQTDEIAKSTMQNRYMIYTHIDNDEHVKRIINVS